MELLDQFYSKISDLRMQVSKKRRNIHIYYSQEKGYIIQIDSEIFHKMKSISEKELLLFKQKISRYLKSGHLRYFRY